MKRPTAFDEAARARKNGTSINLHVALYAIAGSCGSTWFGKTFPTPVPVMPEGKDDDPP